MNAVARPDFTIDAFERGEIDPEAFDHEAHVYMAWLYLERFALPADGAQGEVARLDYERVAEAGGLEEFAGALRRLTERLGVPGKYHATITWFFLLLIGERRSAEPGADWPRFRRRNADLVEDRGLLERYYSRQTLASDRARQAFALPDRLLGTAGRGSALV